MGTFGTEPMDTIASPPPPSSVEPEPEQGVNLEAETHATTHTAPTPTNLSDLHQDQDDNRVHQQHATLTPQTTVNSSDTNTKGYTDSTVQQTQQPPGNLHLSSLQPFGSGSDSSKHTHSHNGQVLRDQLSPSLKTPGTPATPGSTGIMTPHSNRTSYFPATPASGNTFSTTTSSTRSTSTAAFGSNHHQLQHQHEVSSSSSTLKRNNSNSLSVVNTPSRASTPTATFTPGPVVPETSKRSRHLRSDIPPAIVTRAHIPSSTSTPTTAQQYNNNIYQTPSTPRMPSAFSNSNHDLPSSSGFYPTPASSLATATNMATPKTPGSMSEWRMMQMQLQQQDDLHFSLTLPSVSALSHSTPNNRAMNALSSPFGLTPGSGNGSVAASVSGASSVGSCCCCCGSLPPSAANVSTSGPAGGGATVQSPGSSVTIGNATSGPDSTATKRHHHHSFLLDANSPADTLAAAAALAAEPGPGAGEDAGAAATTSGSGSGPQQPDLQSSSQCLYNHCNLSSTSTDFSSTRDCQTHGHGQQRHSHSHAHNTSSGLPLVGSTAILASEYAASSVDPCESDNGHGGTTNAHHHAQHQHQHQHQHQLQHQQYHHQLQFNNGNVHAPSSAGSDAPLNMFKNYPYLLRSAPASAVGGIGSRRRQHCKNCAHHSRRPSVGGTLPPSSAVGEVPHSILGGTEMESTGSSTSITGSAGQHRSSSPSPGSFRNLSSKLAANTIRKLSVSQKSLFSSSKEDLLAGTNSCQCSQESVSREDLNDTLTSESSRANGSGCCCCCVNQHNAGGLGDGSVCSDGNSSATPGNSGNSKGLKMPSKLSLRGTSSTGSRGGGSRSRKDKSKTRRKSREMEYNLSSQFVREEFAQYNYERQIEDFQRAARVFKEQKALTTAAAAASIAAEARAAMAEAQAAAAEAAKNEKQQSSAGEKSTSSSSAASVAISPIQETEEDANDRKETTNRHSTHSNDGISKSRKKSTTSSIRSGGLLRSVSRPQRRVGSSTVSVSSAKSPSRKGYGSNVGGVGSHGSRGSSIHTGKSDASYLELGQVGMGMGMDLKLPGLGLGIGLGSGFGLDAMNFEPISGISPVGAQSMIYSKDMSAIDVRSATMSHDRSEETAAFEDIPLREMAISLPLSRQGKDSTIKLQEDVHSLKGRPSNVSQDTRGSFIGASAAGDATKKGDITRTGRSVHSVCSVDTVSQQISARHHQHSRLATLSNVGSLHSQCQALHSNCETAAGSGSGGCAAVPGGPGIGVGLGGGAASSAYQSATGAILENSPIQVVRATVGTIDDSSLPCFTFRMWTLSTVFVVMGAAIAEYNFFRSNSAYFSIYFVQLASYFCGKAMARCLPTREFELTIPGLNWLLNRRLQGGASSVGLGAGNEDYIGINSDNSNSSGGRRVGSNIIGGSVRCKDRNGLGRSNITSAKKGVGSGLEPTAQRQRRISWRFTLNPGKFNMKEHMLIGVAAAAGCSPVSLSLFFSSSWSVFAQQ